ncbi:30S ribosomal protein S16 [Planctomycetota bacterium]
MVVRIRLTRTGKRNAPSYRIGVFDGKVRRQGRSIELIGYYDPRNKIEAKQYSIDKERALYWLSVGAQPSETVRSLLKKAGISYSTGSTREKRKREKTKARRKARAAGGVAKT